MMDHGSLRERMSEVIRVALATLEHPDDPAQLWGCACELCDELEGDEYGDARTALIAALREDIRVGARPTVDLAEEIVWFVRSVEHDLEDEEADAIVDEVVTRDQSDG